ncbi:hypothetical protein M2271_006876 [Streptomyces sp. LBL]|uniref:hypothetical protein n=1 Tax=Streptomyces sp. LBL TaxID=2940562 RepID=UPI0024755A40|nr:hypothetical protein [Streptomyces sp. LBL]MDH6629041.1 hypothetical protein [Streptomyces sp. LBL]
MMRAAGGSADDAACEHFDAALKPETFQGAHNYSEAATCRSTVIRRLTGYSPAATHTNPCPPSRAKAPVVKRTVSAVRTGAVYVEHGLELLARLQDAAVAK